MEKLVINPLIFEKINKDLIFRFYSTERAIKVIGELEKKRGISAYFVSGTYDIAILQLERDRYALEHLLKDIMHYMVPELSFKVREYLRFGGKVIKSNEHSFSTRSVEKHMGEAIAAMEGKEHDLSSPDLEEEGLVIGRFDHHANSKQYDEYFILLAVPTLFETEKTKRIEDIDRLLEDQIIALGLYHGTSEMGFNFLLHLKTLTHALHEFIYRLHEYADSERIHMKTTTISITKTIVDKYMEGLIFPNVDPHTLELLQSLPRDARISCCTPAALPQMEEIYSKAIECSEIISDPDLCRKLNTVANALMTAMCTYETEHYSGVFLQCAECLVGLLTNAVVSHYGGWDKWDEVIGDLKFRHDKDKLTLGKAVYLFESWVKGYGEVLEVSFEENDFQNLKNVLSIRNKFAHGEEVSLEEFQSSILSLMSFLSRHFRHLRARGGFAKKDS